MATDLQDETEGTEAGSGPSAPSSAPSEEPSVSGSSSLELDDPQPQPQPRRRIQRQAAAAAKVVMANAGRVRKPRGAVCLPCRKLRTTCEGGFPCARCWRLAIPCRPQSLLRAGGGSGGQRRQQAAAAGGGPLLELVFAHSTPGSFAEMYAQAFMSLHEQGQALPERVYFYTRMYYETCLLLNADPTWGFGSVVAKAFNCSPMDVTALEELLLEPPLRVVHQTLQIRRIQSEAVAARLCTEPFYKEVEQQFPDAAIYLGVATPEGMVEASNATFDAWFKSAGDMYDEAIRQRTMSHLLFASLVDPDDRRIYLEGIAWGSFTCRTRNERQTHIIKVFDSDGEMRLYLLSIFPAHFVIQPGNRPAAIVFTFERLPESRHLSLAPGRHGKMQTFRGASNSPTEAPPIPATADAPLAPLPGIACLPVPGPIEAARTLEGVAAADATHALHGLFPPAEAGAVAVAAGGGADSKLPPVLAAEGAAGDGVELLGAGLDGGPLLDDVELLQALLAHDDETELGQGGIKQEGMNA